MHFVPLGTGDVCISIIKLGEITRTLDIRKEKVPFVLCVETEPLRSKAT
jgi:hypothetical protein